jgi:hypothetical protein
VTSREGQALRAALAGPDSLRRWRPPTTSCTCSSFLDHLRHPAYSGTWPHRCRMPLPTTGQGAIPVYGGMATSGAWKCWHGSMMLLPRRHGGATSRGHGCCNTVVPMMQGRGGVYVFPVAGDATRTSSATLFKIMWCYDSIFCYDCLFCTKIVLPYLLRILFNVSDEVGFAR